MLERKLGKKYLQIAGTRPFPGGISSTTWAWYLKHEPQRLCRADLIGHLNTFLHRQVDRGARGRSGQCFVHGRLLDDRFERMERSARQRRAAEKCRSFRRCAMPTKSVAR